MVVIKRCFQTRRVYLGKTGHYHFGSTAPIWVVIHHFIAIESTGGYTLGAKE